MCSRWGAARYGVVLAVDYEHATTRRHQVLPSRESFRLDDATWWACFDGGGFFANIAISRRDLDLWPLDLEIGPWGAGVPETLPTKFGIRRPFCFFSRWRHGTDRQTDRQDRYMMGPPSRKDGPIIINNNKLNNNKLNNHNSINLLSKTRMFSVLSGIDITFNNNLNNTNHSL